MAVFAVWPQDAFAGGGGVSYLGGPVISNVNVNVVYWGNGVSIPLQSSLTQFYHAIVDSDFIDQLAEYDTNVPAMNGQPGTNQFIGRGSVGRELTIQPHNPSKQLTQADIEHELEFQMQSGGLPVADGNSVYMIHFPYGYTINISFGQSCSAWFADHEVYESPTFGSVYYAMIPCGSTDLSQFSTLTTAASHELAEAITDPAPPLAYQHVAYPAAWIAPQSAQEIGDLCAWDGTTLTSGSTVFSVQKMYLNSLGGCSNATFTSSAPSCVTAPQGWPVCSNYAVNSPTYTITSTYNGDGMGASYSCNPGYLAVSATIISSSGTSMCEPGFSGGATGYYDGCVSNPGTGPYNLTAVCAKLPSSVEVLFPPVDRQPTTTYSSVSGNLILSALDILVPSGSEQCIPGISGNSVTHGTCGIPSGQSGYQLVGTAGHVVDIKVGTYNSPGGTPMVMTCPAGYSVTGATEITWTGAFRCDPTIAGNKVFFGNCPYYPQYGYYNLTAVCASMNGSISSSGPVFARD